MEALKSLVLRAQHGDLDAYATLVRRFQAVAIGHAQNHLGDRFLSEDAAQEAFIQVYFDLPRLRNPAAFSGWLRKIVFKHCDRITRRKGFAADSLDTLPDPASTIPQPDEIAEHRETRDRVRQAIDTLPESERTVTSLFYFDGYPQADIGKLLDILTKTVKSRLFTARKKLRERTLDMADFADQVIDKIKIVEHAGKYYPSKRIKDRAYVPSMDDYWCLYRESITNPEAYWAGVAESFRWYQPWDRVHTANLNPNEGPISIRWFEGATTSIAYNCLDRHLNRRANQPAILWEGQAEGESRTLTYRDLHTEVCKCANALTSLGVQKGDVVTLYMPMIPEFPIAMLACARIGAIHNAVFSGFSADILSARLEACESHAVITAAGIVRGNERDCLKATVDQAIQNNPVNTCLVVDRPGFDCPMQEGRDHWWHDVVPEQSSDCPCEEMDAEDPLFILYTGGASSNPKGVLHTTGGYMVYAASTHRNVFDCHDGDIHFCVADIAWITGHSYTVYGPLANGGTVLIAEHPSRQTPPDVYWKLIDHYKVTQLYTAPTHIRQLLTSAPATDHDLSSLRLLGTVGEPIGAKTWKSYHHHIGQERCPIVDTCWQTESGGILITSLPGATPTKPGAVSLPLFGVQPVALDPETGAVLKDNNVEGHLGYAASWLGQIRTLYKDHDRFEQEYFKPYPGYYFTGDTCRRDEDGYYWILGRVIS